MTKNEATSALRESSIREISDAIIDCLSLPASDAEKDFLVKDLVASREATATLYSNSMEVILR